MVNPALLSHAPPPPPLPTSPLHAYTFYHCSISASRCVGPCQSQLVYRYLPFAAPSSQRTKASTDARSLQEKSSPNPLEIRERGRDFADDSRTRSAPAPHFFFAASYTVHDDLRAGQWHTYAHATRKSLAAIHQTRTAPTTTSPSTVALAA